MPPKESLRAYRPLVILGGLTIFAPLIEGGTTHLPVLIIRLILLAAFAAWVVASMKSGEIVMQPSRLFLIIAVFVGWAVVSVFLSPYTAASLQWLISILSYTGMLFLVLYLVESARQVRWLLLVIVGMGLFEAGTGIYQFMWLGRPRATGTFFNPNFFASYEAAVFAVAFGLLCYRRWDKSPRWETVFLWLTTGSVALAFLLAQSRGAALALVAAVAFVGLHRFGKVFLGVLVLSLVVGVLVPNPLQQRVLTIGPQDPYAFTRLDIWKNSLQRIADHPWGVGLGLYKYTSFQYRFPIENAITRYGKRAESAHNEYLQMGVELGVVGVGLFLVGAAFLGVEIRETLRLPLESWERGLVLGLSGGILGILVHGAVDSVFHEPALVLLSLLFAGMILALKRLKAPKSVPVWVVPFPYRPARAVLVGVLVALVVLLIIRPAAAWYAFDSGKREAAVGGVNQALDWYQWATRIDSGASAYHEAVASAEEALYRQSGDLNRLLHAEEELRVGLELNPLDGRLAHRLGGLLVLLASRAGAGAQREALLQQAAVSYEQASRLDPYAPFNYLELGKIRWAQGRQEEAQALFKRAMSYEPNFLPARVQLAEFFLQLGQREAAALEYAEITKTQERYRGQTLTILERQYLDVDLEHLSRALAGMAVL
jgi:O-antigen ligase/Tfp pilus assembly protein PilF